MSARSGGAAGPTDFARVTDSARAPRSAGTTHGVIAADRGGVEGQGAGRDVGTAAVSSAAGTARTADCGGRTVACKTTRSARATGTARTAGRMERVPAPPLPALPPRPPQPPRVWVPVAAECPKPPAPPLPPRAVFSAMVPPLSRPVPLLK